MSLLIDPVEETKEYLEAMEEIQPILDKEFSGHQMGMCYRYWARKKELLQMYGIDWKSPAEQNPDIIFD